jgi:hypothetical protein
MFSPSIFEGIVAAERNFHSIALYSYLFLTKCILAVTVGA